LTRELATVPLATSGQRLLLVGGVLVVGAMIAGMLDAPDKPTRATALPPVTPVAPAGTTPAVWAQAPAAPWWRDGWAGGHAPVDVPQPIAPPVMGPMAPPLAPVAATAPNLVVTGGTAPGCVQNNAAMPVALPADTAPWAQRSASKAPTLDLPFQEAHWQGLELLPNTATLAKSLQLPPDAEGVIVDEATMPADDAGFLAGDMVTAVGGIPTPDLMSFILATSKVRDLAQVDVDIYRKRDARRLVITGLLGWVGTANGETAQTIPPGSKPPHGNQGACTNCHRIGTQGQLPTDQGDLLPLTAPPVTAGTLAPHGNRGTCSACHKIVPNRRAVP
jgi:hypothetical protein